MAGLLDWITGAVKQQYAQGAPYREAISGLLQGDPTKFGLLAQEFNRKAQTPEGALDVALNFAPLGMTKIVSAENLSNLEKNILNSSGEYALQRFQKAKSLVPDLEKQYTEDALKKLFTQRDMYGLTVMKPSEFEKFAAPLGEGVENSQKYSKIKLGADEPFLSYKDYMQYLADAKNKTGFTEVPFLHLNKTETGLPLNPFISGHEGRHRTRVLTQLGDNPTLVELKPRGALYKDLPTNVSDYGIPINTQQEFVDALNKEMSFNKNIRPQTWTEYKPNSLIEEEVRRDALPFSGEVFGAGLLSVPATQLIKPEEKKKKRNTK